MNSRLSVRTPVDIEADLQQMMKQHSCQSMVVCERFANELFQIVGDKIQMIEIDKLRRPCAAVMSLQATGMLTRLQLQKPDPNEDLVPCMESEGANEPELVKKDCFQQYPGMQREPKPPTPAIVSSAESLTSPEEFEKRRSRKGSMATTIGSKRDREQRVSKFRLDIGNKTFNAGDKKVS